MACTIKIKSGKNTSWSSKNPTLATGELGIAYGATQSVSPRLKAGWTNSSGVASQWNALPYLAPDPAVFKDNGEVYFKRTTIGVTGTAGTYYDMTVYPTSSPFSGMTSAIMYATTNTASGDEIANVSVTLKPPVAKKGAADTIYLAQEPPMFIPDVDTTGINGAWASTPNTINLGYSGNEWSAVYAKSGTIQTSDRAAKSDIHYVDYQSTSTMKKSRATTDSAAKLSLENLVQSVRELKPATFCYGENVTENTEGIPTSDIQIGFIADDMLDNPLFKYVGVENTIQKVVTPAVKDEEGNEITPAVTKDSVKRGLQPLPLAAVAIATCKYLLDEIDSLKQEIESLKGVE